MLKASHPLLFLITMSYTHAMGTDNFSEQKLRFSESDVLGNIGPLNEVKSFI